MKTNKKLKYVFGVLSVCLTFISLHAGFQFYSALFGVVVAVLASFTFETLRISSLWGIMNMPIARRLLAWGLYLVTASVCAFVAAASFHASIIESYEEATEKTRIRQKLEIGEIKKAQALEMELELEKLQKEIDRCNINIARFPASGYWERKLEQVTRAKTVKEATRDSVLAVIPEKNIEAWIERESLKYGLERREAREKHGKAFYVSNALGDLWGISGIESKKIIALIIVVGVEFAIIMLALLAEGPDSYHNMYKNGKLKKLLKKYGEKEFAVFLQTVSSYYVEHERLPNASELSRKNREIRKELLELEDYSHILHGLLLEN